MYYSSLSKANSIDTFIIAFMHATAMKKTENIPHEKELQSLIKDTVIILNNADHLTLNEELRDKITYAVQRNSSCKWACPFGGYNQVQIQYG